MTECVKFVSLQVVKTVEHDPKVLDHWIESITALHRTQPPPNVHYSRFCCIVALF